MRQSQHTEFGGMKSYLKLIPLSARVHRRQSRMTRLCILLAVTLVSVIFGMADMEIQCQKIQTVSENGNWHAAFKALSEEQAALLRARPEVEQSSWYDVVNYRLDQDFRLGNTQTVLCGIEEDFFDFFELLGLEEGEFAEEKNSAVFTQSVKKRLGIKLGDQVALKKPDGSELMLTASGFSADASSLIAGGAFGTLVSRETFEEVVADELRKEEDGVIYVRFVPRCNIQKTLEEIRIALGLSEGQIAQNTILLGLMGQSEDPFIKKLYLTAAVLAVLVMAAGILMITGSLNSNIAQRTGFFGMLRCLGATPRQIMRFVRLEALNWCRSAIPAGLLLGTVVIWCLCALLRSLSQVYFGNMPVFRISVPGIAAGALLGIVTVLLAARAPAKKASRVSPLTAVSGNAQTAPVSGRAADTRVFFVETGLGVHHAAGSKRNYCLMTGSFAFLIILFLAFSASIDFMHHAITPLRPYTPDLSVVSPDNTCSVPKELTAELEKKPFVKRVYGRKFAYDVPVLLDGREEKITLISYEKYQFAWAEDMVLEGSVEEARKGEGVMIEYVPGGESEISPGSAVTIGDEQLLVSAVLSYTPFSRTEGTETVICSEELFERLTGQQDDTIIDIQLEASATDADVEEIRKMAGEDVVFSDQRLKNQETRGTYYAYAVFLYGFLAVIAMISAFNIINSIAMSVSARLRQYGAMRAVGMSGGQLVKMVAAEAVTYAVSGIVIGAGAGLLIHRFLYDRLVTFRWGTPWHVPVFYLSVIIAVVACSVGIAVAGPARRLKELSVAETIGEF